MDIHIPNEVVLLASGKRVPEPISPPMDGRMIMMEISFDKDLQMEEANITKNFVLFDAMTMAECEKVFGILGINASFGHLEDYRNRLKEITGYSAFDFATGRAVD